MARKLKQVFMKSNGKVFTVHGESEFNYKFSKAGRCNMDKGYYIELNEMTEAYQTRLADLQVPIDKLRHMMSEMEDKLGELEDKRCETLEREFCPRCKRPKNEDQGLCDMCEAFKQAELADRRKR